MIQGRGSTQKYPLKTTKYYGKIHPRYTNQVLTDMTEQKNQILMEYIDYDGRAHRLCTAPVITGVEFIDTFRAFLYVCGFHHETVTDLLNENIDDATQ